MDVVTHADGDNSEVVKKYLEGILKGYAVNFCCIRKHIKTGRVAKFKQEN